MERRAFLGMLGGVIGAAATRTFPFRVYSFPTEIVIPVLPNIHPYLIYSIYNGERLTAEGIRKLEKQLIGNNVIPIRYKVITDPEILLDFANRDKKEIPQVASGDMKIVEV